jgi:hypothetical protein
MIDQSQLDAVAKKYETLGPHLNEFQRRIWLASEAMELGRGGVVAVAKLAGVSRQMVQRGCREIAGGPIDPMIGARRPGGGRKRAEAKDPTLIEAARAGTCTHRPTAC